MKVSSLEILHEKLLKLQEQTQISIDRWLSIWTLCTDKERFRHPDPGDVLVHFRDSSDLIASIQSFQLYH